MITNTFEDKLEKIPVIRNLYHFLERIKFTYSMNGLSLYSLLKMYFLGIFEGAFTYHASSIAFSFLTSIFPFTLFILNLVPFIPIKGFEEELFVIAKELLPAMAYEDANAIIHDIMNNSQSNLLGWGFFLSIFLMASGINAILESFGSSRHVEEKEGFFRQYFRAIVIALVLVVLLISTITVIISAEILSKDIGLNNLSIYGFSVIHSIKYFLIFLMIFTGVSVLFRYGLDQSHPPPFINTGSVLTLLLFFLTAHLFGFWAEHFSTYNTLYGSIGTLLLVMLYIWINCIIILLGFELNSVIRTHRIDSSRSIFHKLLSFLIRTVKFYKQ